MARRPQLLDATGKPVDRTVLTEEIAAPTLTGVRSPITGYPGNGLDPSSLALILRAADHGDPIRYLELAETIEERDPHYLGVLGTRKRSVSQIPITVEPGSDDAEDLKIAEEIEDWLRRDQLRGELFDVLDAVGKGYSFTEIIWDTSSGQWWPERLKDRDQRWFTFDRVNLDTPYMRDESSAEVPLPGFKFIQARMKAKTGLVTRSGLARVAMWGYLFKKYTERDWAIFTQTFAQPLRLGKWGAGASETDKETLFKAVANIAGDCAAIVPESMHIEFVEAGNIGTSHALYKERADWLDQQVSKAVLGQTTSTDAISGGHAVSKEHREVQEDIERADAVELQGILNRDLVRPFVILNHGPRKHYPRLIIARPEQEDLTSLATALGTLVPLGLQVAEQEIRGKFGLREPAKGEAILGQKSADPAKTAPPAPVSEEEEAENSAESKIEYRLNTLLADLRCSTPESTQSRYTGRSAALSETDLLADRLAEEADPLVEDMLGTIRAMLEGASDFAEFRERLLAGFPELAAEELAGVMAAAMMAAEAGGWVLTEEEAGD